MRIDVKFSSQDRGQTVRVQPISAKGFDWAQEALTTLSLPHDAAYEAVKDAQREGLACDLHSL